MSDTQIQDGKTMTITGLTASAVAGALYTVGGYVGPIIAHIRGTADDYITDGVVGFPLSDGKGLGRGDIALEGVYAFAIKDADQAGVAVGDVIFRTAVEAFVSALNTGDVVGHIYPQDDGSASRLLAADDAEALSDAGQTHVVYVKLFGRPKALA